MATWILGTFSTFPLLGIEAIVGLILIHLHLQKLGGQISIKNTIVIFKSHYQINNGILDIQITVFIDCHLNI